MFTIFESFTHMISSNPLIWIFWSNLFLKVQLKKNILYQRTITMDFPGGSVVKNLPMQRTQC